MDRRTEHIGWSISSIRSQAAYEGWDTRRRHEKDRSDVAVVVSLITKRELTRLALCRLQKRIAELLETQL